MTWNTLTFAFKEILTSTKMNQLQGNFTAMGDGDIGAPKIKEASLDNNIDATGIGFDADKVDGFDAGNANGNVAVNNGTVNTNLNANFLEGSDLATVTAQPRIWAFFYST